MKFSQKVSEAFIGANVKFFTCEHELPAEKLDSM